MKREEMLKRYTEELRVRCRFDGFRREEDGGVVRHVSLGEEDGFVLYADLTDDDADEAIRRQIAYFDAIGQPFEWKAFDYDRPADLRERLRRHGFRVGDPEALMALELTEEHPLLRLPISPDIRRIDGEAEIDAIMGMEDEIWGAPHDDLGERLKRELTGSGERLSIYAAYDGARPVSAAWMYLHEGTTFGSLWGDSTLPDYRGKGLYTALVAARAQEAWESGFRLLAVDASPMSRPILEKKGFELLAFTYPCASPQRRT